MMIVDKDNNDRNKVHSADMYFLDSAFKHERDCKEQWIIHERKVIGFFPSKVHEYVKDGVYIDGSHYMVTSFEVSSPAYLGINSMTGMIAPVFCTVVFGVYPKWDGDTIFALTVRNKLKVFTVIYNGVARVYDSVECFLGEQLPEQRIVLRDGVRVMTDYTQPLFGDKPLTKEMDGVILCTDDTEYRVKKERTYDLKYLSNGDLVDTVNAKKFHTNDKLVVGSVYEVSASGKIIKLRADKQRPLTPEQVVAVDRGVTYEGLRKYMSFKEPMTHVVAHINCYIGMIIKESLKTGLEVLVNRVTLEKLCSGYTIPYPVEEICATLLPVLGNGMETVKLVNIVYDEPDIKFEDNILTVSYYKVKPLSFDTFVEESTGIHIRTLGALKRRLWAKGYVFTGADFKLLCERFLRGYGPYYVVANNDMINHVRAMSVVSYFGFFDTDLPYLSCANGETMECNIAIRWKDIEYRPDKKFATEEHYEVFRDMKTVGYEQLLVMKNTCNVEICPSSVNWYLGKVNANLIPDIGFTGKVVSFASVYSALQHGPKSAAGIADQLGTSRVNVNVILYGFPTIFTRISEQPRMWKIHDTVVNT